jgi:hypothetical protein
LISHSIQKRAWDKDSEFLGVGRGRESSAWSKYQGHPSASPPFRKLAKLTSDLPSQASLRLCNSAMVIGLLFKFTRDHPNFLPAPENMEEFAN